MVLPLHRRLLPLLLLAATSCSREAPAPSALPPPIRPIERSATVAQAPEPDPEPEVLVRCVPSDDPLTVRSLDDLEDRALDAEEKGDAEAMLACAEEALRQSEDDLAAAHLRAEALVHLERYDEAREAFTLALSISPDDPWLLAGAANLYANVLPPSRDRSRIAKAWAERGLSVAPRDDLAIHARLHLLAAWAFSDLADFRGALSHATAAAELDPDDRDPVVAKGRALYELTRFEDAARTLKKAVKTWPEDAEAHHLLGLSLERIKGKLDEAETHLARATELDPQGFPAPVPLEPGEIDDLVHDEMERLPERERGLLLKARVPVKVEPLPDVEDLRAEDPPLSPTAVGMFRGPPLGADEPEAQREILLFARNLRRSAKDLRELREQVRITLLHELGHLVGEDEAALRARGLE